jgi:hypothetical protein
MITFEPAGNIGIAKVLSAATALMLGGRPLPKNIFLAAHLFAPALGCGKQMVVSIPGFFVFVPERPKLNVVPRCIRPAVLRVFAIVIRPASRKEIELAKRRQRGAGYDNIHLSSVNRDRPR